MDTDQVRLSRAADATVLAELVFARPGDELRVVTVTPLVLDDQIVVALPYAYRELAEELSTADQAALVLSDDRMALRGWEPLAVEVRIEVEHDLEGDRFINGLLDQELRKHPPSRLLADSLRDRHDNWWYLPRLLCRVVPAATVRAVGRRSDPTSGVLAWLTGDGLQVETVEVTDADEDRVHLRALSGRDLRGAGDPAVLFRHDYSQPDLERRSERRETGRLEGTVLRDVVREGELALPDPPKLLERLRRHRTLSKGCRRELARSR
jgi:hypothetical protein